MRRADQDKAFVKQSLLVVPVGVWEDCIDGENGISKAEIDKKAHGADWIGAAEHQIHFPSHTLPRYLLGQG